MTFNHSSRPTGLPYADPQIGDGVHSRGSGWLIANDRNSPIGPRTPLVVFLVGAQLDEFLREDAKGNEIAGIHQLARRLF